MTTTRKRILFVDDEPAILEGIENLLYRERKRWDMVFAPDGMRALDELHKQPFDIVVSDMRMPELDGAALLNTVKDERPATVRILLSGYADRNAIMRALPVVHQLLSKPCDARTLRAAIERSLHGVDVERDVRLQRIVGGIEKLPTPPDLYFELSRLMQSPNASLADFANIVARDPAMSAKLLQLVNSSFFITGQPTTSIQQAVSRLGTEQVRYLALTTSVFSSLTPHEACWFPLQELQRGTARAAWLARSLAAPAIRDEAFAATLLHDIGHIVIALGRGPDFETFHQRAADDPDREYHHELALFGVTHADIGARLLAIWGLPSTIIDAVQFHHDPGSAPESSRLLASVVHVADASVPHLPAAAKLNLASLERAGCAGQVAGWQAIAARFADSSSG